MIPFSSTQDGDRQLIDLAFSKKKADERKDWLRQFRVRSSPTVVFFADLVNSMCAAWHVSQPRHG